MNTIELHILNSTSATIDNVLSKLSEFELDNNKSKPHLVFVVNSSSVSFSDMYTQARLFTCVTHWINRGYKVDFRIDQKLRKKNDRISQLEKSGLIECLVTEGVNVVSNLEIMKPHQLDLDYKEMFIEAKAGVYSLPVVPLRAYNITPATDEVQALEQTREILGKVSACATLFLDKMRVPTGNVSLEFGHILWAVLKELILNAIVHSGENKVYVGVTIKRETGYQSRSHHPGTEFYSGTPLWDLCVIDKGLGILPTVVETLIYNNKSDSFFCKNYFRSIPLSKNIDKVSIYETMRAKERALLLSIFNGNLGVRKGRRSEGLYETGRQLHWFGGQLTLRSGRTGVGIKSSHSRNVHLKNLEKKSQYYLPGVILSAILPSRQLWFEQAQGVGYLENTEKRNKLVRKSISIHRIDNLPAGLFGSQGESQARRTGEIFAKEIFSLYLKTIDENLSLREKVHVFEIDLKQSSSVSPEFLDILIQELVKCGTVSYGDFTSSNDSHIFDHIIISNVRRDVINALAEATSNALLMIMNKLCIILDEADQPHFLGIPRTTERSNDIENSLVLLINSWILTADDLKVKLKFDDHQVQLLSEIVPDNGNGIINVAKYDSTYVFYAYDVIKRIKEMRKERLSELDLAYICASNGTVIRLPNEQYVDKVIDFSTFWAPNDRLIDAAKLLIDTIHRSPVQSIIGFTHNGDRLAANLQRFLEVPQLVILDPKDEAAWRSAPRGPGCVLVVDAIYPGDDSDGMIYKFLSYLAQNVETTESGGAISCLLQCILAFVDFRDKPNNELSVGHRKYTVNSVFTSEFGNPKIININSSISTFAVYDEFVPQIQQQRTQERPTSLPKFPKYSEIELSSEFWHNSSALNLITTRYSGREKRNILFYENNEKFIENYRTRRHLEAFVEELVQKKLKFGVDVVLHPSHPVGAFLAHLVAAKLNVSPLIIPLRQSNYGGEIEFSSEDYSVIRRTIDTCEKERGRNYLRALIVDDSVLTGKSIFTMIGIAEKLGLEVNGVFVMLNKLTPQVSASLGIMPFDFSYLYRLHMPVLLSGETAKECVVKKSLKIQNESNSIFANYWATKIILADGNVDVTNIYEDKSNKLAIVSFKCVHDKSVDSLDLHELRQVIEGLILHIDPTILNFETKLAITYNFFDVLTKSTSFWQLFESLLSHSVKYDDCDSLIAYIRWNINQIVFSRFVKQPTVREYLLIYCKDSLNLLLNSKVWHKFPQLVSDCFLALSELEDAAIFNYSEVLINEVATQILKENDSVSNSKDSAWIILGSYAWAIENLRLMKNFKLTDGLRSDLSNILGHIQSAPLQIVFFELFSSFIITDSVFRGQMDIAPTHTQSIKLSLINELLDSHSKKSALYEYLVEAPGYTCTMGLVLEACDAWGVFVFARQKEDRNYQLRTCACKTHPAGDWNVTPTLQKKLPSWIHERMDGGASADCRLFFISDEDDALSTFREFYPNATRLLGAPLRPPQGSEEYFVIFVFDHLNYSKSVQMTEYFSWYVCAAMLRNVLPEIHHKHAISTRVNSALKVAIRNLNHRYTIWSQPPKRQVVTLATILLTSGAMSSRSIDIASQTPKQINKISHELKTTIASLFINIEKAVGMLQFAEDIILSRLYDNNIIEFNDGNNEAIGDNLIAFNISIFEFVFIEMMRNALIHTPEDYYSLHKKIRVTWWVDLSVDSHSPANINFVVENPRKAGVEYNATGKGVAACRDAANIVNGEFLSNPHEKECNYWRSHLRLPVLFMPDILNETLREHLCNLK